MIPELKDILEQHKGDKGVIHTGNYEIQQWIQNRVINSRLKFPSSKTREYELVQHYNSQEDTVLVSPSMINGVDLKDDYSRFQVIMKVPYPNLQGKKVKERMKTNDKWYSWKTLCDLIQAYGRSVRNENDWAVTYILDANFETLISRIRLPMYIKEAIERG